jgi:hypothetical protein
MIEREQYTIDDEGKLVFKEGVETIEPVRKEDQRKIKEITIPEGVKAIADHAFGCDGEEKGGCVKLAKVSVPATLEKIGVWAFGK